MIQIVQDAPKTHVVSVQDWKYDKHTVVVAEYAGSYYMLFYASNFGWIFKNVENHSSGANGYADTPESLVKKFFISLPDVRVWEFGSLREAMNFIDVDKKFRPPNKP